MNAVAPTGLRHTLRRWLDTLLPPLPETEQIAFWQQRYADAVRERNAYKAIAATHNVQWPAAPSTTTVTHVRWTYHDTLTGNWQAVLDAVRSGFLKYQNANYGTAIVDFHAIDKGPWRSIMDDRWRRGLYTGWNAERSRYYDADTYRVERSTGSADRLLREMEVWFADSLWSQLEKVSSPLTMDLAVTFNVPAKERPDIHEVQIAVPEVKIVEIARVPDPEEFERLVQARVEVELLRARRADG